ncbi:hypothetical protein P153DRAFT_392475 [Dothidotthia symphoricarpi CBS 119687]|uniref:Uncharacterized protein n=1 Tax=Dothidotthia symphoricarpi CBS 119687 TaxID=1392245 RepID=A0A6A6ATF3_9PLEO|nr:uncharacterized protein P153DRAFT_392475 [Dothidotthia symphoricarpi CBS 119687]KAF2133831.1 hypothetical protein P153DRAFT_392475 [Dothidotthia symphoricarpi CBS 119687]
MTNVLNEKALKDAGIEFYGEVADLELLQKECPQARILVQYLLDFKHIISYERWREIRELERKQKQFHATTPGCIRIPDKRPPEKRSEMLKDYRKHYDIERCEENFNLASQIKEKADGVESKEEKRWTEIIEKHVFGRLIGEARAAESKVTKQTARGAINRYRAELDHNWTFGREVLQSYCNSNAPKLTAPKPDLFFSFHAYEHSETYGGPLSTDDYIQNFSLTRLSKIYEQYERLAEYNLDCEFGFIPSPCKEFHSLSAYKDLTCFPWAVCEWKHHGHVSTTYERYCYCQAANAAAVCLTLFANAAAGGQQTPILDEIRPVVCMPFVGPETKVWVVYITMIRNGRYKYRMRCIWEGSLHNVVDNVKLCVIIENLHFWALNHLRPWLSSCIDQWRRSIRMMTKLEQQEKDISDMRKSFRSRRAATLDDFLASDSSDTSEEDEGQSDAESREESGEESGEDEEGSEEDEDGSEEDDENSEWDTEAEDEETLY